MDPYIHPHGHPRLAPPDPSPPSQSRLTSPNPDNRHNYPQSQPLSQLPNNSNCATISPQPPPYPTIQQQIIPLGTTTQQPPISLPSHPSPKPNSDGAFEWMVRNLHEAAQRILYLETQLQSKDATLNTFHSNEVFFRKELDLKQKKCQEQGQHIENLRGEVQSLKNIPETYSQSVPKAQYDEVLEQNKKIAENNAKLNQQIDELLKEAEEQKKRVSELGSQNGKFLMESLILQQEIVDLKDQLRQQQQKQHQNKPNEQNEKITKLEAIIVEEQEKVKSLEDKLSSTENLHKTNEEQVQNKLSKANSQIQVLNEKLKTSSASIDSYLGENQNLLKKIESFEAERKLFANEKEQINSKNNVELQNLKESSRQLRSDLQKKDECVAKLRREFDELKNKYESECKRLQHQLDSEKGSVREAKIFAHEQTNQIDVLNKKLDEQKVKLERKSVIITALKTLIANNENDSKELKMQVDNLKLDKDYLNEQLSHRIEEVEKLKLENCSTLNKQNDDEKLKKCIENMKYFKQQVEKKLEENATLLKTREEELKQEKLLTASQKQSLDAADVKTKGLAQLVKALEELVDVKVEALKKISKEKSMLTQLKKHLERDLEQVKHKQEQANSTLNETILEKENEIQKLQEKLTDMEEILGKYTVESIENRDFIDKILAEKAQLKAKVRSLTLPSPFETIEITCVDTFGNIITKMPENDIHLRKLLKINTRKLKYVAHFMRRKLDELWETSETNKNLKGEITSLEKSVESYKESINRLRKKLVGNWIGETDSCKELERNREKYNRLKETVKEHFRVEHEVIIGSSDEEDEEEPYESPSKRAKRSDSECVYEPFKIDDDADDDFKT